MGSAAGVYSGSYRACRHVDWLHMALVGAVSPRRDSETRAGAGMEGQDLFDWNKSYSGDATDYEAPDAGMLDIIEACGRAERWT